MVVGPQLRVRAVLSQDTAQQAFSLVSEFLPGVAACEFNPLWIRHIGHADLLVRNTLANDNLGKSGCHYLGWGALTGKKPRQIALRRHHLKAPGRDTEVIC